MENNGAEILLTERNQVAREAKATPEIRHHRLAYTTRLIIRVVSFATSIVIIAALSRSLDLYRKTSNVTNQYREGSGSFHVWPATMKLYPTRMLLGAAILAATFSLLLILTNFVKEMRRMTKTGNITTLVVSSICFVVWIVVTAYYASWDTTETNWDLMSWVCTHQDPRYDYENIDFSQQCTQLRFAFWASVGLATLELINIIILGIWWLMTRHSRRYTKLQHDNEDGKVLLAPTSTDALYQNRG